MDSPSRPGGEPAKGGAAGAKEDAPASAAAARPSAVMAWLPLLVAIVAMPALAVATTKFFLLPQLQQTLSTQIQSAAVNKGDAHPSAAKINPAQKKTNVPLKKSLVNVSGTMATRYLLVNMTLVGNGEEFRTKINDSQDQLVDLANSILSVKNITDLEKPGARNLIRAELITVFNNALGKDTVQDIYFTEFAVQ